MTRFALTINGRDCIVGVPADMRLLELLATAAHALSTASAANDARSVGTMLVLGLSTVVWR